MFKSKILQREYDRIWKKTYRVKNREKYNAYQRSYHQQNRKQLCGICEKLIMNPSKGQEVHKTCQKEKRRAYQRRWAFVKRQRSGHATYMRRYQRKRLYGLTQEQIISKFQEQEGKCAICKKVFNADGTRKTRDHVDHNHITKKFRGLLCMTCNVGLGAFQDSVELLKAAIAYLSGDV